jgi:hypothetical protein
MVTTSTRFEEHLSMAMGDHLDLLRLDPQLNDFHDLVNSFLSQIDFDYFLLGDKEERQLNFIAYLHLCRDYSWDIASALSHHCDNPIDIDIMYNPNGTDYRPQDEEDRLVINHFKDHDLDLTDPNINWDFDT